jgi:hypothetical protein
MFRLIINVKRGIVPDLAEAWVAYPTLDAARSAARSLSRHERVAHVLIVRDEAPPVFVEWVV